MKIKGDVLKAELEAYADVLRCELRWKNTWHGMMYVEFGYVECPNPEEVHDTLKAYMIGMHELGHVTHGHTQGRPIENYPNETLVTFGGGDRWYFDNGVLKSEAEAWEWALDSSIIESGYPNDLRVFMADYCFGSYIQSAVPGAPVRLGNGDRAYVTDAVWDEVTPYVQSIRDRLLGFVEETT